VRWLVKEDEQRASLMTLITVSLFRPFHLLFTEPAVFFFSLWVSFAWAVLYLTFGSIPLVFSRQHGFNLEQSGYVFIAMIVGSVVATTMGVYQESLLKYPKWQRKSAADPDAQPRGFWSFMRRHFPVEVPESRLYFTCISSVFLPLGLYMFGFLSKPSIHWIVPTIAIFFATMGIYTIYLATFNYLADSYQTYASSALAAQSFCRNMLAGAFPLVVGPLFTNLGESRAGGLLGAIATVLTVVPWVLAIFGEKVRRRSKFAVVSNLSVISQLSCDADIMNRRWSTTMNKFVSPMFAHASQLYYIINNCTECCPHKQHLKSRERAPYVPCDHMLLLRG
jgi:hypothetical protein